ncbi:MAG: hypothetical protein MK135_03720 [Polyangiaceae bacterium]|nr:hypothetical protein [Polyangiaceae bacterium]
MTFRTSCFALTLSLSTVGLLAACGAELQAPDATPDNDGLSATGGMVGSGGGASLTGGAATQLPSGVGGSSTGGTTPGASGGSFGSGGMTASGGQTSGGSGESEGCQPTDLFCEDFEAAAIDSAPTGNGWQALGDSCEFQTSRFTSGVSALPTPRGSSTKAWRSTNATDAQCRLTAQLAEADEYWLRSYIYWDASVDFSSRETLAMEMIPAESIGSDSPSLRFGNRSKAPCTESAGAQITMIDLGGGEVTGCDGSQPLPQGKWYCFEAHVQQSANLIVETFVDGVDLSYSSTGKPAVDALDLGQAGKKVDHLRIGIFSTSQDTAGDVFIDDIRVASERIGCN